MLTLYRSGLSLRRELPELGAGTLTWEERAGDQHVMAFRRGDGFVSVTNLGGQPVDAAGPPRDPASPARRWKEVGCPRTPRPGSGSAEPAPTTLDRPDPPWHARSNP